MKRARLGKIIFFSLILVAALCFMKLYDINLISPEKMKEIQNVVDETSIGKVQVNWKDVAAIASVEYAPDTMTKQEIEKTANLFIEKKETQYRLKEIDEVMEALTYSEKQKKEVNAYLKYLNGEGKNSNLENKDSLQVSFISSIKEGAIDNYNEYGILPSITIAQAILESGWGKSELSVKYNNIFGIKSYNWDGKSANISTSEFHEENIQADFRVYDTISDSLQDHSVFLTENPRYEKSGLFSAKTYSEQATALQEAGYSTIENEAGEKIYSELLIELIRQHQLQLIDSEAQLGHG
ncbi:glycoside hydrolase family 73 protein [Peribacillus frigoritolerans]|uniref:glycoside hydrolase family 73 protein n=1 Tax=Peribacillus frigoritolerans TaxID=450367 RepID=UPI0019259592|nr:glucosaminidase domain-containing protein [Peribacillus frigoritolerans]MBL3645046.1 glucosaminidase domain-containing protein [Bacillus sp. RHFB]MEE3951954.1 glucosaminidase domain-containing protein [Peribacillus frigoritolerans]